MSRFVQNPPPGSEKIKVVYGDRMLQHHNGTGDVKDTDVDLVRQQIRGILIDRRNTSAPLLKVKYAYTWLHFPSLFEEARLPQDPPKFVDQLETMLTFILRIQNDSLSQRQASELVGTDLAEKYIFEPGLAPRPPTNENTST